jgi:hypothetical protein
MNPRTRNLFIAYGPMNGGFRETRTSTGNPGTATPGIADASVVDSMAVWNQNQWGDPRFPVPPALTRTKYIYGDYNPKTLPGIVNGVKSDTMTTGAAGITKFTDLTESFRQSVLISDIDGLPVGALIWDDTKLAAYNPANEFAEVMAKYISSSWWPPSQSVTAEPVSPTSFSLAQNYPNPFNPSTIIRYSLPHRSHVTLIVYNTLGQQVVVPVSGEQEAGNHEVQFDGSALASGVYFYRMQAESFAETKRFLLLR